MLLTLPHLGSFLCYRPYVQVRLLYLCRNVHASRGYEAGIRVAVSIGRNCVKAMEEYCRCGNYPLTEAEPPRQLDDGWWSYNVPAKVSRELPGWYASFAFPLLTIGKADRDC